MNSLGPPAEQMPPGEAPTPEELGKCFVPFWEIQQPVSTKIPIATHDDLNFFMPSTSKMDRHSKMKRFAMMIGIGLLSAAVGIFLGIVFFGG